MSRASDREASEYTDDESAPGPMMYGKLCTRLRWESNPGVLHLDVKQQVETIRGLECKLKGQINTKKGTFQHRASLCKSIYSNTPSLARIAAKERGISIDGSDQISTSRLLPGGLFSLFVADWAFSPGILFKSPPSAAMATSSPEPSTSFNYMLQVQKLPQVVLRRNSWDSWVTGKVRWELDPSTQGVMGAAGLRLKLFKKALTTTQDVRLTAGLDYDWGGGGAPRQSPYWKLSENNWTVRHQRGTTSFAYEF